ncbi:response regulator [Desulfovibrio inopinatus]|uniref:response regulator n=1 Tax=Desulfovibrio inopinatus TaxID=102109 RepID=UPI000407130A|nr:response regulator [Desulfovibrio inopinatus]
MKDKTTVLVVDDEERFASNMVRILTENGLVAKAANTGEHALNILANEEFDVVLLDVKMPGLSGVGTLERMNVMDLPSKVVILTGHASMDDAMALLDMGAVDYLIKPAKTSEVLKMIDHAKDLHDLHRESVTGSPRP